MEDRSQEIADLESILNAGVEETSVDGTRTKIDQAAVRKRIVEIRSRDLDAIESRMVRPRVMRIELS